MLYLTKMSNLRVSMKKNYRTTSFINDSGERQCLIVDYKNNLPLYYPNLFLTTQLRNNKSYSFSSISSAASSLIVFLNFLRKWNIDIVNRLCNKTYLSIHELDILRDFTQKKEPTKTLANKAIIKFKKTINTVETTTHYMRLTIIAKYLCWLANILIPFPSYDVSNQINRLEIQIKSRRPSKKRRNKNSDNSLDNLQLQALFEAIKVGSQYNPFNITTQSRNQLMILMFISPGPTRWGIT